jgi:hypothetical protein
MKRQRLSAEHRAYLRFHHVLWREMPHVKHGAKSLYALLLTFEKLTTNDCWPCQETLSRHLRCDVASVRKWTLEAVEANLIRTSRMLKNGKWSIVYELFAPQPQKKSKSSSPKQPDNVVPFPTPNETNSTQSTTPSAGSTEST